MKRKKALQLPSGKVAQVVYELIFSDKDFRDISAFNDLRKNAHRLDELEKMRYAEFTAKSAKPKECAIRFIKIFGDDHVNLLQMDTSHFMQFDDLKCIYADICALIIFEESTKYKIPDIDFEEYLPF